jgi:hypothetical protein
MDGWSDDGDVREIGPDNGSRRKPQSQEISGRSSITNNDDHLSDTLHPRVKDDLIEELEQLRHENERLKQERNTTLPQAAHPASTYKIFHYIDDICYLDEPQWVPGDGTTRLLANNPIRNIQYYLDQHPDIAFAIFKTYLSKAPRDLTKIETKDGVFRVPEPKSQNLSLISQTMIEAVEEFTELVPDFNYFFPYFDPRRAIKAPFLFMYYSAPYMPDVVPKLDRTSRHLVDQLDECIQISHGFEHTPARSLSKKGQVSKNLFKYLIRPGDVLVKIAGPQTRAYLALDWVKEIADPDEGRSEDYDEWGEYTRKRVPNRGTKNHDARTYSWKVPVWSWAFDGRFNKNREDLVLDMKASYATEIVPIEQLNIIPLRFASPDLEETLERRGKTFWQLRHRRFVSYHQNEDGDLGGVRCFHFVSILDTTNSPAG